MTEAQPLLDPKFLARLEQLELVSKKIFLGRMKGERRSKKKGQSVEFADYRNYVIGDDLRFLDWNLYARLDRLFIRLFMEEEDLHFHVLIDNSLSMDFGKPSKLHFATQVAAAVGARPHAGCVGGVGCKGSAGGGPPHPPRATRRALPASSQAARGSSSC